MTSDNLDLPWPIEANLLDKTGKSFANSNIDLVIARYLMSGDVRPLAWWLDYGHVPGSNLLKYVSAMLSPGNAPKDKLPFELVAKNRNKKRGRPPKGPEQELRDLLIFCQVEAIMERIGPGSYDAAITEVAGYQGLERPTVKRAYDAMRALVAQSKS